MNLILLFPEDFVGEHRVKLYGRRRNHILNVQNPQLEQCLTVGLINGQLGTGRITHISRDLVEMEIAFTDNPPPPLPITLVLALPRPNMLRRIYQTVATMGVKKLILINSFRVEKSFWQSPVLHKNTIRNHMILGLEQSKDTVVPDVIIHKRFKVFVEDELPAVMQHTLPLVAHPGAGKLCPQNVNQPVTLAVGPEGGFIPYEVDKLMACGFTPVHLGHRILRVETAIAVLLAKLF